jgi:hypothetical protein
MGPPRRTGTSSKAAIAAFLADLLTANGKWVYRRVRRTASTGQLVPVRFFLLQLAMRELGLWNIGQAF